MEWFEAASGAAVVVDPATMRPYSVVTYAESYVAATAPGEATEVRYRYEERRATYTYGR